MRYALFLCAAAVYAASPARETPGVIVVDASEFYDRIPAGDTITAAGNHPGWIFNNSVLSMASKEDAVARIVAPEAGDYRLFVRSWGTPASGFKVSIGGKTAAAVFGNGPVSFAGAETFHLEKGTSEVRLTGIAPRPVLDVLVLAKDANFSENDLRPLELPDEVVLLKDYKIPNSSIVKFGDVDGDGSMDFLVITTNYSAYMYGNDGKELWHWDAPEKDARLRGEFEAPGSVWDFDRDGKAEVIHWRILDGVEYLVMANGRTGEILRKTPWPTKPLPHVYNNFRTAIARFGPGYADNLVVFTDSGGTINITAYDRELKQVWQHSEARAKDFFGHFIYPVDLDGDGIDEVVVSHLCLDSKGKVRWSNYHLFDDNHDHMDSIDFVDLNGDGRPELITGQSDIGALAYDARTGEMLWHNLADHTQQIAGGYVLKGRMTPQVLASGRIYGQGLSAQLYFFDNEGALLSKWPRNPIAGNPDFVRGDWYGGGTQQFFWHKFKLEDDGRGTLFFKEPVFHMFDFVGNGAEQVITLERTTLRVYGHRNPQRKGGLMTDRSGRVVRNSEYVRNSIANHTHY